MINIRKGSQEWTVEVLNLADKRGSATLAQTLYQESKESIEAREAQAQIKRMEFHSSPKTAGRPNKKQRRALHNIKGKN